MPISELAQLTGRLARGSCSSTDAEQLQRVHSMADNGPRSTTGECQQQLIVALVCSSQGRKVASPYIIGRH